MGMEALGDIENAATQLALWNYLQDTHPTPLRREDLVLQLATNRKEFPDRDSVLRAIDVLIRVGLCDECLDYINLTPAALYSHLLAELD